MINLINSIVDAVMNWMLGRTSPPRPSDEEVANIIDRYLVEPNKHADGEVINIEYGTYRYYIVRSLIKRYKKRRV